MEGKSRLWGVSMKVRQKCRKADSKHTHLNNLLHKYITLSGKCTSLKMFLLKFHRKKVLGKINVPKFTLNV